MRGLAFQTTSNHLLSNHRVSVSLHNTCVRRPRVINMVASIAPKDALDILTGSGSTKSIYLDVRTPSEYQSGHPPNAVNVSVSLTGNNDSFVEDVKKAISSDANLIVGCKSGKRSTKAIDLLSKDDIFEGRLTELEGGFDRWASDPQLPVEKN